MLKKVEKKEAIRGEIFQESYKRNSHGICNVNSLSPFESYPNSRQYGPFSNTPTVERHTCIKFKDDDTDDGGDDE